MTRFPIASWVETSSEQEARAVKSDIHCENSEVDLFKKHTRMVAKSESLVSKPQKEVRDETSPAEGRGSGEAAGVVSELSREAPVFQIFIQALAGFICSESQIT